MRVSTSFDQLRARLTDLLRQYGSGALPAERAMQVLASFVPGYDTPARPHEQTSSEPRIYRDFRGRAWRAMFQIQGMSYNRYFADSSYGGPEHSKEEALRFVSQVEAYQDLKGLASRFKVRKNTRSGVPGVARIDPKAGRGAFWMGYWTDPSNGRKRSKKFSVSIYGEEGAKGLAMDYREKAMEDMMSKYAQMLESLKSFCVTPSETLRQ